MVSGHVQSAFHSPLGAPESQVSGTRLGSSGVHPEAQWLPERSLHWGVSRSKVKAAGMRHAACTCLSLHIGQPPLLSRLPACDCRSIAQSLERGCRPGSKSRRSKQLPGGCWGQAEEQSRSGPLASAQVTSSVCGGANIFLFKGASSVRVSCGMLHVGLCGSLGWSLGASASHLKTEMGTQMRLIGFASQRPPLWAT